MFDLDVARPETEVTLMRRVRECRLAIRMGRLDHAADRGRAIKVFSDIRSGKTMERPGLEALKAVSNSV